MNNFNPNDSKWTAYVLNELSDAERRALDQEMERNPAARKLVEEIRSFTGELKTALDREPAVELDSEKREAIYRASEKKPEGKVFHLPAWAYTSIGVAAAALVMLLVGVPRLAKEDIRVQESASKENIIPISGSEVGQETELAESVPTPDSEVFQRAKLTETPVPAAQGTPARLVAPAMIPAAEMARDDKYDFSVTAPQPMPQRSQDYLYASERKGPASPLVMKGLYAGRSAGGRMYRTALDIDSSRLAEMPENNAPFLSPSLDDFQQVSENKFIRVEDHPLSTFSIDVDTASYAVVRRFLTDGTMPPKDAVRIEELINYFPYDYAPPQDNVPFAAHIEIASCPWQPEHQLVRIALKGREITREKRPASKLVFLIDVSGSMSPPNKLTLVKRAMQALTKQLDQRDQVAIVVYAGAAGLVLPSTRGDNTQAILEALERLESGGSTAGGEGIQLAYKVAQDQFEAKAVNRVILCTDGDFNVGLTQRGDLERLIEKQAKSGVSLTVLGFGMGNYKDSTLELLADKGNGNYAYIDDFCEARKVLVDQMVGTLVTIAKDVKIQVEFNPARVAGYRLVGYENRMLNKEDFNNDKIDAGDIGAGHTVTAFYELIPAGGEVTTAPSVDDLKYQPKAGSDKTTASADILTVKLRYKQPDSDVSSKLEFPLAASELDEKELSRDFRFATAVAGFGMLLRDSENRGSFTYDNVISMAESALGEDQFGYRAEFLKLVRNAKSIDHPSSSNPVPQPYVE